MAVIKSGSSTDQLFITASNAAKVDGSAVTQPVSISGTVPVSGTFFQATQPISASSLPLPSGAAQEHTSAGSPASVRLSDGSSFYKGTTPADTQPISGSVSVSNFPASQAVTGTFFQSIQPTTASDVLTKGTQGATGFSVQDLKDAGRSIRTFIANQISSVTAEAMATLTPQQDGTIGSPATSFAVTAAKRLRLQHFVVTSRATAAAVARSTFFLRMAASGAVTTASAIVAILEATGPAATAITGGQVAVSLPDGIEFSGSQQFGVSHISPVATHVENITLVGYEY